MTMARLPFWGRRNVHAAIDARETTSWSDQVKIATLLFLSLFYTEAEFACLRLNGNKLTTSALCLAVPGRKYARFPTLLPMPVLYYCNKFCPVHRLVHRNSKL